MMGCFSCLVGQSWIVLPLFAYALVLSQEFLVVFYSRFFINLGLWVVLFSGMAVDVAAAESITLGSGGVTGVYYPAGRALCRLVNKERSTHGIRCAVESTSGSLYNLDALGAQELDLGITQSDWEYHAYKGSGQLLDVAANSDLRTVFSMHTEAFTVVAREDSGIRSIDDIKGKRVNLGNPGSGQYATMKMLMKAKGWTEDDFSRVFEMSASNQATALCNDQIDVMVYIVGHPSGAIKEATTSCRSVIVDVTGDEVDQLINSHSYYRFASIPGGMYQGNKREVATFGVGATLISSVHVSDTVIYQVVRSVFEHFDEFKRSHPVFARLTKQQMVADSLSAPFHAGAVKYYKEVGLLK